MFPQCILTQALLIFSGGKVCTYVSSHATKLRVQVCRLCLLLQNPHAAVCHSQPQQRLVGHSSRSNLQFTMSSICICVFCFVFWACSSYSQASEHCLACMLAVQMRSI